MKNWKIHWQKWRRRLNDTATMVLTVHRKIIAFKCGEKWSLAQTDGSIWFVSIRNGNCNDLNQWWQSRAISMCDGHCTLQAARSLFNSIAVENYSSKSSSSDLNSLLLTSSDIKCIIALTTIDEFSRRKFIESTTSSRDANWNQFYRNGLAFFRLAYLKLLGFACI